jgi:hypothetical protein
MPGTFRISKRRGLPASSGGTTSVQREAPMPDPVVAAAASRAEGFVVVGHDLADAGGKRCCAEPIKSGRTG